VRECQADAGWSSRVAGGGDVVQVVSGNAGWGAQAPGTGQLLVVARVCERCRVVAGDAWVVSEKRGAVDGCVYVM